MRLPGWSQGSGWEITSQRHTSPYPHPTARLHRRPQMGRDGWASRKLMFQNIPFWSLPVGNQNWMVKNGGEMGVESGMQPGQGGVH